MPLSIHYYVLSLSKQTTRLFEGFRESLIEIHNARFPFANAYPTDESKSPRISAGQLRGFLSKTDEHLAHYFDQEPLWVMLIGMQKHIALFETLTVHKGALIGNLAIEFTAISSSDLGKIHSSGRKSLILGCTAHRVLGVSAAKSAELLVGLREWATSAQFSYSHEWKVGDLVMWDNTGTLHRAEAYDLASGRMLHRTKLAGEEPFA
jgi:hypothetical protein